MAKTENTKVVSPEEFVQIWQTSNSIEEVAKRTGRTYNSVRARGIKYRDEKQIPLKEFPRQNRSLDVEALRKLAQQTAA